MRPVGVRLRRIGIALLMATVSLGSAASTAWAIEIVLRDGRLLRGKLGETSSLGEAPQPFQIENNDAPPQILFLDDDLRRTFFPFRLVRKQQPDNDRPLDEKFTLPQRVLRANTQHRGVQEIKSIGQPVRIQPFDEFGRRTFTILTAKGVLPVVQGITELTPQWAKVEATKYIWDMRIATSSIPRETLHKILLRQIDADNPKLEDRQRIERYKKVARFYLQCERYIEARKVLEELVAIFPSSTELKEQLEPVLRSIVQLSAEKLLQELQLRRDAGQHDLVRRRLNEFPAKDVGGETLQAVREMIQDYQTRESRRKDVVKHLKNLTKRTADLIAKENLRPILDEMAAEIGVDKNTLDRMAAFLQNAGDPQTPDADKIALGISGWLMGADAATPKLSTAISAYKVRGLIRQYLTESDVPLREQAFGYIQSESAGDPSMVSELLAHMKPALKAPAPIAGKPGFYELEVQGLAKEPPVTYYVQLPPEYNPYRLYPTIVTLNGEVTTAEQQIDWWAGAPSEKNGTRLGQAGRYGYILIAPVWTVDRQAQYRYSAHEHAAVLNSLRDACRRFAIDTDRVYLSGHSMGGNAAWDMGLAHPDLWAGVIPIVAQCDRYCSRYWENAKYVPFYVVGGEKDGGVHNATDLDRYLRRGFDITVVEYRGRGHEDFYDEILRIFDWMGRFRRNFFPKEFDCRTMRAWDNFFWYVETTGLPPRSEVDPANWPPPRGTEPARVKGKITATNGVSVVTGTNQATVWLSPKMVDFKRRVSVTVNGHPINDREQLRPNLHVLLEDVRTRGDRQHPFWAKVER
jgi:hypothetical protein